MPFPAGRYTRSGLCDEVVGTGCCPIFGIWQDADFRRLAKCDAGPPFEGGFFRCGGDSLRYSWTCPNVGATWGFVALLRTHPQPARKAAHSGDTRLTAVNSACRRNEYATCTLQILRSLIRQKLRLITFLGMLHFLRSVLFQFIQNLMSIFLKHLAHNIHTAVKCRIIFRFLIIFLQ